MPVSFLGIKNIGLEPESVQLYTPPIVWKGDSVGHVGYFDVFFLVTQGECFLNVAGQSYVVKSGQLAFLPKGKLRQYTQISKSFSMYELRFNASADGESLMQALGLADGNFVVDLHSDGALRLFESSCHQEFTQSPLHRVAMCSSLISIIKIYAEERQRQGGSDTGFFKPVLEYMSENMSSAVTLSHLSALVYMHPTYFVKRFGECFGMPPLAYLNRMRIYQAMGLLSGTEMSVEEIARSVGFSDSSYFARAFKKQTGATPTEYRNAFKRP